MPAERFPKSLERLLANSRLQDTSSRGTNPAAHMYQHIQTHTDTDTNRNTRTGKALNRKQNKKGGQKQKQKQKQKQTILEEEAEFGQQIRRGNISLSR